jgi:DNA processing protein
MPSEVEARIAWGFMAQPGDPFARTLCTALGPREALARVVGNGSVSRVTAGIALEDTPLTAAHRERLKASYDPDTVRRSMAVQERAGIIALEQSHPDWPETLHDLGDAAPLTLWVRGDPGAWSVSTPRLAVVGSRAPTAAGLAHTASIIAGPWLDHAAVISGGATGIDTVAHHAALLHHRVPIAVLAGGLEGVYPTQNSGLMNHVAQAGAIFSEAPCGMRVRPEKFLARNRLIAALSHGVIVVEAAYRSGAINTAHHAANLGREVAVVPGRWDDKASRGCFRLAKDLGARILTEPADAGLVLPLGSGVRA